MNAIQTLGDAVSKLGKQINDLQREVAGRKSHAHRLSLELKQSESWRESLSKDLEALQQSFEKAVTSDNLRRDIITRLETSNSALSADCNARQAREQELNTIVVALQSELKSLNDQLTQHCAVNVDLQVAIERLTKELNDARESLVSAGLIRNEQEFRYSDLRIDLETMTNDRDSLIRDKESLVDEIKALQFTIEKRDEAIKDAIVYINSLPPLVHTRDEIAITAPVQKRLIEILNQGAQK